MCRRCPGRFAGRRRRFRVQDIVGAGGGSGRNARVVCNRAALAQVEGIGRQGGRRRGCCRACTAVDGRATSWKEGSWSSRVCCLPTQLEVGGGGRGGARMEVRPRSDGGRQAVVRTAAGLVWANERWGGEIELVGERTRHMLSTWWNFGSRRLQRETAA
jgi:hypothetical protein